MRGKDGPGGGNEEKERACNWGERKRLTFGKKKKREKGRAWLRGRTSRGKEEMVIHRVAEAVCSLGCVG